MDGVEVRIVQLLVSRAHRFEGRPADGPGPEQPDELVQQATVRAGLGLVGDRYFNRPAHRDASVTFVAEEALAGLSAAGRAPDLRVVRRNVLVRGLDVDGLIGTVLRVDCGTGPVRFRVHRPAQPCRWLDVTVGDGAWRALRGHGGIRTRPLDDGVLRVGPASVEIDDDDRDLDRDAREPQ